MKQAISASFSRAACTYECWATVQKEVAGLLLQELPDITPRRILEIGCGTGIYTELLKRRFSYGRILALDISHSMARQTLARIQKAEGHLQAQVQQADGIQVLCADGEMLPFSCDQKPFDLITSNSVFHWFQTPQTSIQAAYDLLEVNGCLHFSYFGHQSLLELQNAIMQTGLDCSSLAVTRFLNKDRLTNLLKNVSQRYSLKEITITRRYTDLLHLLKALKYTGVTPTARPFHLSPGHIKRIENAYLQTHGTILASYQVFLCTIFAK
ncbi:MAG: methyltransferase domain-containing protein [Dissulfuribacterales bacterium]